MSRAPLILDLGKGVRGIYSVAIFHVGAKSALLRRFFMLTHKKASSARSLAPPFQIATAYAGLRFGFGCRPGGMSSKLFARSTSEQASYRLLRFFIKVSAAHFAAPPFQIATACAGLQFGFGFRPGGMSSKLFELHTWSQSKLCDRALLCSHAKKRHLPALLPYRQNLTMIKRIEGVT